MQQCSKERFRQCDEENIRGKSNENENIAYECGNEANDSCKVKMDE